MTDISLQIDTLFLSTKRLSNLIQLYTLQNEHAKALCIEELRHMRITIYQALDNLGEEVPPE